MGICQENYRCFLPGHLHENDIDLLLMPYSYPDLNASGGFVSPPGSFTATWYARQLRVPVVTSNKTSPCPQVADAYYFPGRSAIASHDATIVTELGDEPGVAVAEVRLNHGARPGLEPIADPIGTRSHGRRAVCPNRNLEIRWANAPRIDATGHD